MTAAAAVVAVNALKACGVVVRLQPVEWLTILSRSEAPLVVVATGGVFKKHVRYLTSYRGLAFFTQSPQPLSLPREAEVIEAQSISVPDV